MCSSTHTHMHAHMHAHAHTYMHMEENGLIFIMYNGKKKEKQNKRTNKKTHSEEGSALKSLTFSFSLEHKYCLKALGHLTLFYRQFQINKSEHPVTSHPTSNDSPVLATKNEFPVTFYSVLKSCS